MRAEVVIEEEEEEGICNALCGVGNDAGVETSEAIAVVDFLCCVENAVVGFVWRGVGG